MEHPLTKEEFKALFADELRGLLVEAFADNHLAEKAQNPGVAEAAKGKMIVGQFRKAQGLLERMYDALQPKPAVPAQPKVKT